MSTNSNVKIKIENIDQNNQEVKFSWEDSLGKRHQKTLNLGDSLSEIHSDFGNLNIVSVESNTILLPNGLSLNNGDFFTSPKNK